MRAGQDNGGGSFIIRFAALDGWRGICAPLIAIFHFHIDSPISTSLFVRHSWMLVDFFFVLSGFVIAHAYAGKLSTGRDLMAFLIRRIGRLWPLHAFFLAILVCAAAAKYLVRAKGFNIEVTSNPENTPYSVLTNLLFLHSFGLHKAVTWNTPSWSISAEFLTNVIFGVAFALVPKGRIAAALVLSAIGAFVLLVFSERTINTAEDFGLFRCMYGFFIGYVVYRIVVAYGSPLRQMTPASIAELASIIAVAAFVSICASSPSRMFAPFVFAVAIWVFAAERGVFSRLLQCRPLVIVGLLSYSIYMSHMMIITAANNAFQVATRLASKSTADSWESLFSNKWYLDALVIAFIVTIIAVSWCTYNFLEVPLRRRFNRMANRISPKREIEPLGVSLQDLTGSPQSVPAAE